jgi:hypothetical protein
MKMMALFLGIMWAAGVALAADSLDGSTWTVRLVPDAEASNRGERVADDVLIFDKGQFSSTTFVPFGFKPGRYVAGATGGAWTAQLASGTYGTIDWTGQVSENTITGNCVLHKNDGSTIRYSFSGKKQGP